MNEQELKDKITNIRMWALGDQRVPHKPLLTLYALGRILRGEPQKVLYGEAKGGLKNFSYHSGIPFYYLQSDCV